MMEQELNEAKLQQEFTRELVELENSGAGLPFVYAPSEAWMLLSVLQLALRHPGLQDSSAVHTFARTLAQNIEARLCQTPAMKEVARRGWHTAYDCTCESDVLGRCVVHHQTEGRVGEV